LADERSAYVAQYVVSHPERPETEEGIRGAWAQGRDMMLFKSLIAIGLLVLGFSLAFLIVHNGPIVCGKFADSGPACHIEMTLNP
jgi:hypothetical protein